MDLAHIVGKGDADGKDYCAEEGLRSWIPKWIVAS